MDYIRAWADFYIHPNRLASRLAAAPAPWWGLAASVQRAAMDSVLLYLPLVIVGRLPPERSYLAFIPTEHYYAALIGLAPVVLIAEWLLSGAVMHLCLRVLKRRTDFDQILNVSGLGALAIGSLLLIWDWSWILIGGMNQYLLGISHLVIDLWGVTIGAICLKRILDLPVWIGVGVNLIGIAAALPLAIMFMRSPL